MAIRTYKVTLDSKNTIAPEPVFLRQGDKTGAVVIDATLMDNGTPVSLSGLTPMFKANTADGQAVIADSTGFAIVDASGGKFTYQVPSQLGSVDGKIKIAYFSFSDASGTQSTFNVAFIVEKAADMTKESAKDWVSTLSEIIEKYNQWANDAHNSWEQFVNDNKAIIESIDPSGKVLSELIDFRHSDMLSKTFDTAKLRGDFFDSDLRDRGVNVKWFGAVGDGITDDTIALKKARDFCDEKLNQILFFPPGTYIFNETIQFENEVNLVGTDSSWLKYGGSSDALVLGADGMTIDNYQKNKRYSVSNLGFTGGENSTYGIHFNKFVTQAVVQNCNFENFGGTKDESCFAIWFDENNWYGLVQNCKFDVTTNGGRRQFVGMATFGNSRVEVKDNLVTNLNGFGVAVLLDGFNCQLIGNKIEGYQVNVRLGSEASNAIIAYNYFEKSNNISSGAVEIGDFDANIQKYPTGIFVNNNYCNLHEDIDGKSYFISPSNSQALINNLTISDNYINGYTDADPSGNHAYIVYQNGIAGQTGNIAERNRGLGLAGIFRPQPNVNPWNGTDSIVQIMEPIGSGTLTKQMLTTDGTAELDILNPDYTPSVQMKITASKDIFLYHNARLLAKAFSTGQLAFGKEAAVCDYDFAGDLKAKTIGVSEQTNSDASAGQIYEGTDGNLYYMNLKGQKKQLTS